jgi:hypothetical protein
MDLQQALADDDSVVYDETFKMGLDGNNDKRITASEDDGECDGITNDLHGEHRDAVIRSVKFFSVV